MFSRYLDFEDGFEYTAENADAHIYSYLREKDFGRLFTQRELRKLSIQGPRCISTAVYTRVGDKLPLDIFNNNSVCKNFVAACNFLLQSRAFKTVHVQLSQLSKDGTQSITNTSILPRSASTSHIAADLRNLDLSDIVKKYGS